MVKFYYFLSEIGAGWIPAKLNSEKELDAIRFQYSGVSNGMSFAVGGAALSMGPIMLSNYNSEQSLGAGETEFLYSLKSLIWHAFLSSATFNAETCKANGT